MAIQLFDGSVDEQVSFVVSTAMDRSHRANFMYELAGPFEFPSPYKQTLNEIDAAIGKLKALRREMQSIAQHVHEWDESDYCSICGADGRA